MEPSRFPIPVSALQQFLPHRPPMVWVTRVISADANEGVCEVDFNRDAPYCSTDGKLRQSTMVEWMAQGFGYAQATVTDLESNRAYLAAVRDLEFCSEQEWQRVQNSLVNGSVIKVHTKLLKILSPISLISGEVFAPDGTRLAHGTFKLFIASTHR